MTTSLKERLSVEDRLYAYGRVLDDASAEQTPRVARMQASAPRKRSARLAVPAMAIAAVLGFTEIRGGVNEIAVGTRSKRTQSSDMGRVFPLAKANLGVSDTFGAPRMMGTKYAHKHQGADLFAPAGTGVVAIGSGRLFNVGTTELAGNKLWLRDNHGDCFYYAGLSEFAPDVKNGAKVRAGQLLGVIGPGMESGTTASQSVPPMLHFEMHPSCGDGYNPTLLLRILAAEVEIGRTLQIVEATAPKEACGMLGGC